MPFSAWLESLFVSRRRKSPRKKPLARSVRLESLEERTLLAIVSWDGGGGNDFSWNNAANWDFPDNNTLPGPNDDVLIGEAFGNIAVVLSGSPATIHSLTSAAGVRLNGTLSLSQDSTLTNLALFGGSLNGNGDITVSESFHWQTGTINGPVGSRMTVEGQAVINGGSGFTFLVGRELRFAEQAYVEWQSGNVFLTEDARLVNEGEIDIRTNNVLGRYDSTPGSLINHGLISKSAGNFTSGFMLDVENFGTIEAVSGSLYIGGPSATSVNQSTGRISVLNGRVTFEGAIDSAAGSTIEALDVSFSGSPGAIAGTYRATGSTFIGGGVWNFTGDVQGLGALTIRGTANFSAATGPATYTIPNLVLAGGTLEGTADFVTSDFHWGPGRISGATTSRLTVEGQTLIDVGSGLCFLAGRELRIGQQAYVEWRSGNVFLTEGARLVNEGEIDIRTNNTLARYDSTAGSLVNHGLISKSAGSGGASFRVDFSNVGGTVEVQTGVLNLGSSPVQSAGQLILNGGSLASDDILHLQGGSLIGSGSVHGRLASDAELSPGFSPGQITIHGNYVQSAAAAFSAELGGLAAGNLHDQLDVHGTVSLAGSLDVSLIDGFQPAVGDTFLILANDGNDLIAGRFSDLADEAEFVADRHRFRIDYDGGDGNDVVLTSLGPDNSPPVAVDGEVSTDEDVAVTVDLRQFVSDAESAAGDLSYSIVSVSAGNLEVTGTNGVYTFTPDENFYGDVFVSYYVTDEGALESETKAITIHVASVNDLPSAEGASVVTDEDSFVEIDLRTLVFDVEMAIGDLTFTVAASSHGTVSLIDGHIARYSPDSFFQALGEDEIGMDAFEFVVSDGDGGTATATVSVTVEGRNDAPIAAGTLPDIAVDQNAEPTVIDLAGLFTDLDASDVLTMTASSSSTSLVSATVTGNTLTLEYLANQFGAATITVMVTDPHGATASVSFTVHVLSPEEQAEEVMALIDEWRADGQVNGGQANSLNAKINNALAKYAQGNITAAENQLAALKNQIGALVRPGGLTSQDADLAIGFIDELIASMRP